MLVGSKICRTGIVEEVEQVGDWETRSRFHVEVMHRVVFIEERRSSSTSHSTPEDSEFHSELQHGKAIFDRSFRCHLRQISSGVAPDPVGGINEFKRKKAFFLSLRADPH